MKKFLLFLLVLVMFFSVSPTTVHAKELTASDYLEAAREYYNNPNLQIEDLYENMSWVGIGPAPKPDKPGINIPDEYLPQTGEQFILNDVTIFVGIMLLACGIIILGYKVRRD